MQRGKNEKRDLLCRVGVLRISEPGFVGFHSLRKDLMYTTTSHASDKPMTVSAAAAHLRVSATPISKGLRARLIPDLSISTVGALVSRPVLTSLVTPEGAPVPVLRQPDSSPADPTQQPVRALLGYDIDMSDEVFLAASDRWWVPSGRDSVLNAGAFIVACGSIVVGWLDVDGIREINANNEAHFDARLVARWDGDAVTGAAYVVDSESPNVTDAVSVMGLRVLGGRGGSFTTLGG